MEWTSANWPGSVPFEPQDFVNTPSLVNLAMRVCCRCRPRRKCCRPCPRPRRRDDRTHPLRARARKRAIARRRWRRLGNVDRFRLAAQQHQDAAAGGIELDHHTAIGIHGPDIVLAVDADLLGDEETVKSPADLADEIAGGIELKQLCRRCSQRCANRPARRSDCRSA